MTAIPQLTVRSRQVPAFMYGTAWKEDNTPTCTYEAIKAGFRAIDTANQRKHYFEAGVGQGIQQAIEEGLVTRDDLFLQTKFTHLGGQDHRLPYDPQAPIGTQVRQSFASSQKHLGTDKLDSYVLHGPSQRVGLADQDWEAYEAMEALHDEGLVGLLGISNVGLDQIKQFTEKARVKPAFVQNRCYAHTGWDRAVRQYCREHDITYQGFSLLTANLPIFEQPWFKHQVSTKKCTPAQLVFQFAAKQGMLPLTGTTNPQHMSEDLECFSVNLTDEEATQLETLLI